MKKNPYEKNILKTCAACDKSVMLDQYGNGECSHCGWYNCRLDNVQPDVVVFPNLVSLNKAKQFAKNKKPIKPTIDDFIEGLLMYNEMQFSYNNQDYVVFKINDGAIELAVVNKEGQFFANKEDFKSKAQVENRLLKDVWQEVKNVKYM